jgi:hypothetical protein
VRLSTARERVQMTEHPGLACARSVASPGGGPSGRRCGGTPPNPRLPRPLRPRGRARRLRHHDRLRANAGAPPIRHRPRPPGHRPFGRHRQSSSWERHATGTWSESSGRPACGRCSGRSGMVAAGGWFVAGAAGERCGRESCSGWQGRGGRESGVVGAIGDCSALSRAGPCTNARAYRYKAASMS